MDTPAPPSLTVTPQYNALMQQAQTDQTDQLQQQAESDTASLMARYGTRLALAPAAAPSAVLGKAA